MKDYTVFGIDGVIFVKDGVVFMNGDIVFVKDLAVSGERIFISLKCA